MINGYYYFELPAGVINSVRIDTGIFPSVTVSIQELTYNRMDNWTQFFELNSEKVLEALLAAVFVAFCTSGLWAFYKKKKRI
ncbi:hypothetical protein LJC61_07100 [Ruminococcaceae bacterium OttesenSCG-928-A16]|nr:hypothetical protein [Ruminococcaceae bacterium OttesenSCG-928-A16]